MIDPKTYILNHLNYSNQTLAGITRLSVWQVKWIIKAAHVKRDQEQLEAIYSRKGELQIGAGNPNWKGGIAGDHYRYKKTQRERWPEKIAARMKLYNAVKQGILKRQPCEVCGDPKSQAHHPDYSKPLEVIFLCSFHHKLVEREHSNSLIGVLKKKEPKRKDFNKHLNQQLTLGLY